MSALERGPAVSAGPQPSAAAVGGGEDEGARWVDDLPTFSITDPLPVGTTLLEASAGTGKTWTIASLVTRYVAEGVCRLDEMLVVTFGRVASQELRQRVREQLVAAGRVLAHRDGAGLDPHELDELDERILPLLDLLLHASPEELALRQHRVRAALADFDSATIATTHQFCHLVLAGLGVAGDTDAAAHLVEDLDDLLVEVVSDLYVEDYAGAAGRPPLTLPTALAIARAAVSDPQARLEPAGAAPDSPVGARVAFGERVRSELERRKRRLGVLSYDDLLGQLAAALADDRAPARARMRATWKVVLVDEFQDTDPVQWQVLDRAFSGVATMVLIGDPKQAIYAFRGGDIVTYLAAADTATMRATIGTNQRSDGALVSGLLAMLRGAGLGDDRIVVRDVEARHLEPRLVGAPHPEPFRLRVADRYLLGEPGTKGVAIGVLRDHVAKDLALDVLALLASNATFCGAPLLPRDVAVLCRTGSQCDTVAEALAQVGIRSVVSGSGSVFRTEAAQSWLTLLEAMEQPHRTDRVRAAALTPFLGRTAEQLDEGGADLTDGVAETLRDWALLLRQRGVAAVLETASADGTFAARVLGLVGGERLMTDLRHAGEALHDVASRDGLELVALVSWLRHQMTDDRSAVAAERARRLDSDASAVQVLTIHASKGLEFPVVYLPTVNDLYVGATPRTLLYHDELGARCLDVGGDPTADVVSRVRDEELDEELRVLYVALTRAQSQVVTWWFPSAKNTWSAPLHRVLFGRGPGDRETPRWVELPDDRTAIERLRRWAAEGGATVERAEPTPAGPTPTPLAGGILTARPFTRAVDRLWTRTSYTALSNAAAEAGDPATLGPTSEPEDAPRSDEPPIMTTVFEGRREQAGEAASAESDQTTPESRPLVVREPVRSPMADLPVGATFGSLVHAVLEHADPAAPERQGDWRAELRHHVGEQLVRWPVDLDAELLADALVAVCDTPLGPLAPTTLRQVSVGDRMQELDFELPLGGGDDLAAAARRGGGGTLRDLAALLRRHLDADDPLASYADVVDDPAYEQALRGYLSGSLDLVLRVGGRYVVCDYKTNWLGDLDDLDDLDGPTGPDTRDGGRARLTSDDYRPDRLAAAMGHSSYPLQALLYAVVLHRFLRWRLSDYDPETHLGGVLYLYVRGMCGPDTPVIDGETCGVFSWRPPVALVEGLSDLLDGIVTPDTVPLAGRRAEVSS
ncbi:UvrD-helicase domain-containing protein [Lapillicoccus sp.]|uniref:UvrD-helicase domain-containing protein n=1 Tax=Lapillicoccus sp. TaxID=1909287 RepID=UPI0025E4ECE2|nr:UvrD-helicase domain-containing protein [Lapillicoccus sp.]